LAVDTTRLRVGTLVTSITHRPIGVLAKMVTTLHAISGGRAVLGLGSGWHQAEHEMFGLTLPSVRDRMELLDESLVAIRALFVADTPVTFEGRCVTLRNATLDPRPTAHTPLPILVGGSGIRLRTIAARHADIYNGFWTPDAWQEVNLDLDERVATFGRNPADLRRSAFVPAELSSAPTRQRQFLELQASSRGGSHDDVLGRCIVAGRGPLEVLRRFHEAGVDQVILSVEPTTDPDDLARFAEEIVTEIERW
jgi:alkanesulfonate monooxygenase SsuD/methylene tetrahydromethanopterin reductase-like flavin-dependent oxidoreductase (luciferase family)